MLKAVSKPNSYQIKSMKTHYETLGVSRAATEEEIKLAYRRLIRQTHPDANTGQDTSEQFQEVLRAYETLSDPVKKEYYDITVGQLEAFSSNKEENSAFRWDGDFSHEDFILYAKYLARKHNSEEIVLSGLIGRGCHPAEAEKIALRVIGNKLKVRKKAKMAGAALALVLIGAASSQLIPNSMLRGSPSDDFSQVAVVTPEERTEGTPSVAKVENTSEQPIEDTVKEGSLLSDLIPSFDEETQSFKLKSIKLPKTEEFKGATDIFEGKALRVSKIHEIRGPRKGEITVLFSASPLNAVYSCKNCAPLLMTMSFFPEKEPSIAVSSALSPVGIYGNNGVISVKQMQPKFEVVGAGKSMLRLKDSYINVGQVIGFTTLVELTESGATTTFSYPSFEDNSASPTCTEQRRCSKYSVDLNFNPSDSKYWDIVATTTGFIEVQPGANSPEKIEQVFEYSQGKYVLLKEKKSSSAPSSLAVVPPSEQLLKDLASPPVAPPKKAKVFSFPEEEKLSPTFPALDTN